MNLTETKHTPGPWRYDKVSYGVDLNFHIQTVDMSHKDTYIADVGGGLQSDDVITANAKLISAAPDLLEVCMEIMRVYESKGSLHHFDVNIARTAIQKATS